MSEKPKACPPEFYVARYERARRFCVRALPIAAGLGAVATGVLLRLLNSSPSAAFDWSSTLLVAGFDFAVLAVYLALRGDAAARIVSKLRNFTPLPPRVFPPEEPVGLESKGLPRWDWTSKTVILAAIALLAYCGHSDGIRIEGGDGRIRSADAGHGRRRHWLAGTRAVFRRRDSSDHTHRL